MKKKNVALLGPGDLPPDDGETWIDPPKSNDRMWSVVLHNRGRTQTGTLTIWRLQALISGIVKRYPRACKSNAVTKPMIVRRERAGRVVATVTPLEGPVASRATRQ